MGKARLDVLAVKGVVTSRWLYESPDGRPLSDIDLRVRPRDFSAVADLAARERWSVIRRVWTYRNLVLDVDGVAVDVECDLGPPGVSALSVEQAFARATHDPRGFWVPEIHDHALLLTLNVFKDKIDLAMPWALDDVARVVDAPSFDVRTFVARVREARTVGPAWVVADWMADVRNHTTWRRVRALLGGDAPARRRYTSLARRLFAESDSFSLPVRVLARAASDDPVRWPLALGQSLAWMLESRWFAYRHPRAARAGHGASTAMSPSK